MSTIYNNMINLVFSIEIRGSPSRLVDIKVLESGARDLSQHEQSDFRIEIRGLPSRLVDIAVLESGARDKHFLCGSEGYQSEAIVACFLMQTVFRLLGQKYLLPPLSR